MAPAYHSSADNLRILSGLASDSSVGYHLERLGTQNLSVRVEAIISVTPLQGLEENLRGYTKKIVKYAFFEVLGKFSALGV